MIPTRLQAASFAQPACATLISLSLTVTAGIVRNVTQESTRLLLVAQTARAVGQILTRLQEASLSRRARAIRASRDLTGEHVQSVSRGSTRLRLEMLRVVTV